MLGKFLPFHKGHARLIDFAESRCDRLTVLVCSTRDEEIPGEVRLGWIEEFYRRNEKIEAVHLRYDERILPNTSVSSREVSRRWAVHLREHFPPFDLVFTSEEYGDFLAEFLGAEHLAFDLSKEIVPVSGTQIRENPFLYWDFLPDPVKPHFVKKVCLIGTESTGKSVLTERLARHFKTAFVPEMARDIIEKTVECTSDHLRQIAELHARTILETVPKADKLLFVDTDVNITRSYSRFLFGEELRVEDWIERANRFDLYLYLEKDADFVQDGTRLVQTERDLLDLSHRQIFAEKKIELTGIGGDWEGRFERALQVVSEKFF